MPEPPCSYKIERGADEINLIINCIGCIYYPAMEDNAMCMRRIIDRLLELGNVTTITLSADRNYVYPFEQVKLLNEVRDVIVFLIKEKTILSLPAQGLECTKCYAGKFPIIKHLMELVRGDPIGGYVETIREIRRQKIFQRKSEDTCPDCYARFIGTLTEISSALGKTKLIQLVKEKLPGYKIGDRSLYRLLFKPLIKPNFMFTRLMVETPIRATEVDSYTIGEDTDVTIYKIPAKTRFVYYVLPPEFKLNEEEYTLLSESREAMIKYKPKAKEFVDPSRMREVFFSIAKDLLEELSKSKGVRMKYERIEKLAKVLVRLTVGFGLTEVLLFDSKVEDIYINGPIGKLPIIIKHADYGECETNIIPNIKDADAWATRFRMLSGRPLDEANPVLDTTLELPHARARVCAVQEPLSPVGLSFAFRHHRPWPWTLPLYIKVKMISPISAGLISFLVDGSRSVLIAGTRGTGKSSLLGSLIGEILRRYRTIIIEDTPELPITYFRNLLQYNILGLKVRSALSGETGELSAEEGIRASLRLGDSALIIGEVRSSIRGNQEVFIVEDSITKRVQIKDLENKPIDNVYVPTLDENLKISLHKLKGFVKHPARKKLLEVITRTGRRVIVTPDHSLFTQYGFKVGPIETSFLKPKDKILIPASMPSGYNDIDYLDLTNLLPGFRLCNYELLLRKAISILGYKKATKICELKSGDIYIYLRKSPKKARIPVTKFKKLMKEANIDFLLDSLEIKRVTSNTLPAKLKINNDFCRFLGYYISEGYISTDKTGITLTNSNKEIIDDVCSLSKKLFKTKPYVRKVKGIGYSTQMRISNSPLAHLILKLGCGRTSKEKRVPPIIFGLSKKKICSFLKGLYSGDGSFIASKLSGNAIRFFSTSKKLAEDVSYLLLTLNIVAKFYLKKPHGLGNRTLYVVEFKRRKEVQTFLKEVGFVHKKPKIISKAWIHTTANSVDFNKDLLKRHFVLPRKYRHLRRFCRCSKYYLKRVVNDGETKASSLAKTFANGQFYLDEIKEIKEINLPQEEPVYDLSVNPTENFIGGFGGIILHNTEARSLFEAMRVGAMANVVAGTIHADSPYGVFDRVVNDLGVTPTSFKAADIAVIATKVRDPSGLKEIRRVVNITEIRKHWREDPSQEGGFLSLMEYDAKDDLLKPTPSLIEGESEVVKAIAARTRAWVGKWDLVWENILLRAKAKKMLVDYADMYEMPGILEANFTVLANEQFHVIMSDLSEEIGYPEPKEVIARYEDWLKVKIKSKKEI